MSENPQLAKFDRQRAFLVEDEILIAMNTEDMLTDLNIDVSVMATNLSDAIQIAKDASFDFAILDVNLAGERSYPVADILRGRGIPYIFVSGYGTIGMPEDYKSDLQIQKPFRQRDLEHTINQLLLRKTSGD